MSEFNVPGLTTALAATARNKTVKGKARDILAHSIPQIH
jgi:hypothetical protein